ncbi:ADP-ribosylglycohydrolase family protein [Paludisphaera mucosa]|uniref:ADP-ribosylglycohydrolase family protein n=1 Tax=Paludisphaera mucosa TaxID=3030827 RepID=A0ABT6F7R6_9BACT|nr:ADP-ribosylglycohydrolase family protein [Paludisphaera mucosa]MDG3003536.1 ADP-ribosylglycohydrolase family protein [Paludisphaera mucosa]
MVKQKMNAGQGPAEGGVTASGKCRRVFLGLKTADSSKVRLMRDDRRDRLAATLLGTALGDALGLPCEGLSPRTIARRFGPIDRFRLLGRTGYVSDDTEQSALVAQSLAQHPDDVVACVRAFRRALFGWFCRLPWGIGKATILSCLRIGAGISPSGVRSAGNGAAMRSAIVGVFFRDQPERRRRFARALAEVTHRDSRAIDGSLYVAEVASVCAVSDENAPTPALLREARIVIQDEQLGRAIDEALAMADAGRTTDQAAQACGTSGFVVATAAFATFCFARHGDDPLKAVSEVVAAGGDTDSIAAIAGAWAGARSGLHRLPAALLDRIHDRPFGPSHLRKLAACLDDRARRRPHPVPGYS